MKKLSDLMKNVSADSLPDLEIPSIHYNSKDVRPGGLFVAIKGLAADGHAYAKHAAENGASVIVTEKEIPHMENGPLVIRVKNTRTALSHMAARFYSREGKTPSQRLILVGVTGTNGKTTVTYLIENILSRAGFTPGVIGTVNYRYQDKVFPNPMTTPESLDLQRILFEMAESGVTHAVMEVSSHAVDLDRIADCLFDVGVFTNLTQEHLDYHKNLESYWACKKRLFTEYLNKGPKAGKTTAVINCDDPWGEKTARETAANLLTTGTGKKAAITAESPRFHLSGTTCTVNTPEGEFHLDSTLAGRFNLENILNAVGAAVALGLPLQTIKEGIETFANAPGRLESIQNPRGLHVFVDYAHTPDALENVLSTLKSLAKGRLITVFGCGGDRDRGKRPKMAAISEKYSDISIVTSDNPRMENPGQIISHILEGFSPLFPEFKPSGENRQPAAPKVFAVEPDRRSAIRLGIAMARPLDTVVIAGKGHEDYQILGTETIFFDDRIEATAALEEKETL